MAAGNVVTLTFAGDDDKLAKSFASVGASSAKMAEDVGGGANRMSSALDKSSFATEFLVGQVSDLSGATDGLVNLTRESTLRTERQARAQLDVTQASLDMAQAFGDAEQATVDLNQAFLDGAQAGQDFRQSQRDAAQAGLDVEQAQIDAAQSQRDYNDAVKEHGKNSIEARQASLDMKQAQEDLKQAQEDLTQSQLDGVQANVDAQQSAADVGQAHRDGAQAATDAKGAQLDLNEAQRNASPPTGLQQWTERLSQIAPALLTAVSLTQLFTTATLASKVASIASASASGVWTAAQWLLNVALIANPIGLIIIAIAALIGIIILIAVKTTWFQDAWRVSWGFIKDTAIDVWNWMKTLPEKIGGAFKSITGFITAPFRAAFNYVSDAWNNTIGKMSWTVPGWVPFIGGNTISAPHLPKFHAGGVVPGPPGTEMMALLQAGERVSPAGSSGATVLELRSSGTAIDDMLLEILRHAVSVRGGNVQFVVGT